MWSKIFKDSAASVKAWQSRRRAGSALTEAGDESGEGDPPAVGSKFIVYRLGSAKGTDLSGRNAGNADGVALHLANLQGEFSAKDHGDTIHAFEVSVGKEFGKYQGLNKSKGLDTDEVGRINKNGMVSYSFGNRATPRS
jgi:hypothetical protein